MIELEQRLVVGSHPVTWEKLTGFQPSILLYLLPDDQLPPYLREERPGAEVGQGMPQTVRLITAVETIRMTKAVSEFLYALNPRLPRSAFAGILNTWVPGEGSKVGDDNYITNPDFAGDDSKYFCKLTFGCNVLKAKSNAPFLQNNKMVWEVESINYQNLPDPATLPIWLKTHLTIIHPSIYEDPITKVKRQRVNPFPQNGGREGKPCFVAPLSAAPLFIDAGRVKVVDYVPKVYWPPAFTSI